MKDNGIVGTLTRRRNKSIFLEYIGKNVSIFIFDTVLLLVIQCAGKYGKWKRRDNWRRRERNAVDKRGRSNGGGGNAVNGSVYYRPRSSSHVAVVQFFYFLNYISDKSIWNEPPTDGFCNIRNIFFFFRIFFQYKSAELFFWKSITYNNSCSSVRD